MKVNEIACMLETWRGRREALDTPINVLREALGMPPESPLCEAIDDVFDAYTLLLSARIGDTQDWLGWYQHECQMGNHPMEVIPFEGAQPILIDRDLRKLAELIAACRHALPEPQP